MRTITFRTFASAVAMLLAVTTVAQARDVRVNTAQGIYDAIQSAQAGDVILIKPATYNMNKHVLSLEAVGTAAKPIILRADGDRGYATLHITASGDVSVHVTGAHWIIRGINFEGNPSTVDVIQIKGSQGHGSHLTFVDCKASGGLQSAIKGSFNLGRDGLPDDDDNVIDHCEFYDVGQTALDLDGGKNWVVRDNYVHDYGVPALTNAQVEKANGSTSYGIFIKGGAINGIIEGNFVDGKKINGTVGISFGGGRMGKQWLRKLPNGHYAPEVVGGICRNNIVVNTEDVAYHSNDAYQCKYYNNLAYHCGSGYQRQNGYDPGATLVNNVLSGNMRRAGLTRHNLMRVEKGWFVNPEQDNFTLTAAGKAALQGKAVPLKDNPVDYFGQPRVAPYTLGPVNADETGTTKWVDARHSGKPTKLPKNGY